MEVFYILFPIFALIVDRIFGEFPSQFHPICFAGNLAYKAENICRKGKNGKAMFWRGVCGFGFVLVPCLCITMLSVYIPLLCGYNFLASCIALFWTYICIAPRSLAEHARNIAKPLEENNISKAQYELSMIVGRNTAVLDEFAIARACIESIAENLTDGVLSSLFWAMFALVSCFVLENLYSFSFLYYSPVFIVFCVVFHRLANMLDAMWGKKNEKYINFGTMSAITDDILNYIPARLGLFTVAIASIFVSNCNALQSLRIGIRYRKAHESPNSAWTESAFAGALSLKLGGIAHYEGISANHPFIGEGSVEARAKDIYNAIHLMWASSLVFVSMLSIFYYFLINIFE